MLAARRDTGGEGRDQDADYGGRDLDAEETG